MILSSLRLCRCGKTKEKQKQLIATVQATKKLFSLSFQGQDRASFMNEFYIIAHEIPQTLSLNLPVSSY
jgi:hypothetical protein